MFGRTCCADDLILDPVYVGALNNAIVIPGKYSR